ncbi:efflux RND transporter periplasmic adaptor subunit [Lysobacter enzymogenes]|uniref:efflux RND transporter periplasmic adaptor subunit n=1 Tax=Lysobacter enzymogenes TaxID=69 RepID=UPI001A974A2E|nr:efflux RND transporter periplasmic adaptor subunit [Lysobacter enzymogenes]QQP97284.1 efflux RND transporter periplasmic adaptor subunit [Lysobacter enzymogenes]
MDVQKSKVETPFWRSRNKLIGVGGAAVLATAVAVALMSGNAVAVSEGDLLIDTVQQGSLDVTVEGYGELVSAKQQLLTSPSQATVREIVLKPGAEVTADSVIVRLEDPELLKTYQTAKQSLNEAESTLRQLRLTNQREKLKEQSDQAELGADLATATVQRQAEEKLVSSGIVSRMTFEKTVQNERQLKERIALGKAGMAQLDQLQRESLEVQQDQVQQMQANLALAQDQLDRLTVKAGMNGVLQKLPVEMGQSLPPGEQVALVGSATELIALIRVPQGQAQSVHIGNEVVVDTRREKLKGKVARIVPIVANNTVEIEVSLPSIAGTSARPNLSVDGSIIGDHLDKVRYVRRPAGVNPNSTAQVYAMAAGSSKAKPKEVKFGRQAGQYIEVLSGLDTGERLIVSDLSKLKLNGESLSVQSR